MKLSLSYFLFLFVIFFVSAPFYIQTPKLLKGYRAYVYCNNNTCNKGYVLNVRQKNLFQDVKANFLDKKDKMLYNKLLNDLNYDKNNKMYIISSVKDCIENQVKTKDIETQLKFKHLPIKLPDENIKKNTTTCINLNSKSQKKDEEKENILCDVKITFTDENISNAEYYIRYLLYKLA